jgi:hypothetical protein
MGYGLVNGFINHLNTPLGTTHNYSAVTGLHSSQITTAHAKPFPACFHLFPGNEFLQWRIFSFCGHATAHWLTFHN